MGQIAGGPPLVVQRVLNCDGTPKVVPGVRVVVELEQPLQHADGRLAIHRRELGVEVWRVQHVSRAINQPAAP
ncbi:MAG: hypothetical protein ACXVHI_05710 [Frankiaceae bacterium]